MTLYIDSHFIDCQKTSILLVSVNQRYIAAY